MALTPAERKEYTDAVLCLQSKPPRTNTHDAPGVKSRYDDFVATHIKQSQHIHATATFLAWHRFFLFTFEEALRNECGYPGYLPYWNWARTSSDILNAPDFDGGPYSMGSNGAYRAHPSIFLTGPGRPMIRLPPFGGGGCVKSGPFSNMSVNLGPILPAYAMGPIVPGPFTYHPRCLTRDLSPMVATEFQKESLIVDLITQSPDLKSFQQTLQGDPQRGIMSLHAAGHIVLGGDPSVDFYVSSGEPLFFLHHSMVDRVWWLWQQLDPAQRTQTIYGTGTMYNIPPSPKMTLEDYIDLDVNAGPIQLKNLMSTIEGPFNYVYV
ncbi:hypothetical protein CROQUDRAFT_44897 [Cronartium quercuum f. sp. fusiforme G11]|uniref:Tyrosinase copper-binding domain-containing protein n=1 Tax=Cronartium quercuum f. sp. fusiforme G11 TaxID=708437 RepID=A0A9P6NKZ6_9BASI|nr:hypothetical protein CROQUDRAFT_44897 [Cronartium quercuum f. sp. fusiforme G11]